MSEDDAKELERYTAQLRREEADWRAQFERVLHTDRAAVDIGLVALRTAILINAGAVVALLAFIGQLWNSGDTMLSAVLAEIPSFVFGLVAAGLAAGVAYFYQSFVAEQEESVLAKISEGTRSLFSQDTLARLVFWTALAMITLVLSSYGLFIWGVFGIIAVLG